MVDYETAYKEWFTLEVKQGMAVSTYLFPTLAAAIRAGRMMLYAHSVECQIWKGDRPHKPSDSAFLWTGGGNDNIEARFVLDIADHGAISEIQEALEFALAWKKQQAQREAGTRFGRTRKIREMDAQYFRWKPLVRLLDNYRQTLPQMENDNE